MLIKKELAEIPPLSPPKMQKDAKYKFSAAAKTAVLEKSGKVLCVDFFCVKDSALKMRFFSDKKGFILFLPNEEKSWNSRLPAKILVGNVWSSDDVFCTQKAADMAHKFLKKGLPSYHYYRHDLLKECDAFASELASRKREAASNRREELKKKHFAMFPKLPKDLPKYCETNVFDTYIFFDKIKGGKREARCGRCGKSFDVQKDVKHKESTECPECHAKAQYYQAWLKSRPENKANLCICHRVNGNLLMRWADVVRTYADNKPCYIFQDNYYYLCIQNAQKTACYSYALRNVTFYGWMWCRLRNGTINHVKAFIYPNNLNETFGERYRNVDLKTAMAENRFPIDFEALLQNLEKLPEAEYLVKLGLYRLASEISEADLMQGKSFTEVLGVNCQYRHMYRNLNISLNEHKLVASLHSWVNVNLMRRCRSIFDDTNLLKIKQVLNLEHMSLEQLVNYFEKQKNNCRKIKMDRLIRWYQDYIDMSQSLGVDLSRKAVRFPRDIKAAHDQLLPRFYAAKQDAENKLFEDNTQEIYQKIPDFQDQDFVIVLPKSRTDLTVEGQSLSHCVGGDSYYKNHIHGIKMIFFVRKAEAPEVPYFTMEIDMERFKITQLYGFKDSNPPPPVRKFANAFLQQLAVALRNQRLKAAG